MSASTREAMSADRRIGRAWVWFTTAAISAIFLQSVTAGRILSGDDWARKTHRALAGLLVVVVLAVALAALAVLRDRGRQMAAVLLALAACLVVEYQLGAAAAEGKDTVWLHVPFGVAMVALAAQANRLARRLADLPLQRAKRTLHG